MRTSEGMQGVKTAWRYLDVVGSSGVNGDFYIFPVLDRGRNI